MSQINASAQASHKDDTASQDEALGWFLKLQTDPDNVRLKQAFSAWKDSHPENESRYLEVLLLWDNIDRVDEAAATVLPESVNVAGFADRVRPRKFYYGAGALLCFVMLVLMVFIPGAALVPLNDADYMTASGRQDMYLLEDGSRLYMSGGSAVDVGMTPTGRTITLHRGEAFFEVANDPLRPFQVQAGDTLTTAVGTAFNVSLSASQVIVTLTEGVVDAGAGANQVRLTAGQELLYRKGVIEVQAGSTRYWPAWRRGTVSVEDMPVSELVTLLNRHYSAVIRSVDPRLLDARVSGILPLDDLSTTLEMLQKILGIRHVAFSESLVLLHR
ncbi:FecR family protein [Aliamphritea ceti]|uniref:FecR family protein n=1 Tax=Aliamphritea ceti TaxID=1524258 RepID=UPI0021C44D9C|nr:FecR domain-containing protein [Aliamphritea ceti]